MWNFHTRCEYQEVLSIDHLRKLGEVQTEAISKN